MGNRLYGILNRIFDYPIKRKPICFHRQEDFTSTGEPIPSVERERNEPQTEYDKLLSTFYSKLLEHRRESREFHEKNKQWSMQNIVTQYPEWNEIVITNLHNLFLLFKSDLNGLLGFENFCALLLSLGDETQDDVRKEKFNKEDADKDGWINYEEFLNVTYNFSPIEDGKLTGLGKLCYDVAEDIKFVSNLSVGEQLEYGLF
ncbi:hypothetical protein FQR65_LT05897 [Abscondita terminalis]|nr:hypothetical protein FQR65_LT05897 [Abscondita terminalis]